MGKKKMKSQSQTDQALKDSSKKRRISHKGALQKGKDFERWCANNLKHVFPFAQRHLEYQASNAKGYDLDNTGDYLMQLKCKINYVPINTIKEVQIENKKHIPVLITKANNEPPMVVLPFKEFVTLLEFKYGLREPSKRADAKKMKKVKETISKVFETTPSLSAVEGLAGLI